MAPGIYFMTPFAMMVGFSLSGLVTSWFATRGIGSLKIDGFCESMGFVSILDNPTTTFCNRDCNTYISADCQRSNGTLVIKFICPLTQITHTDVVAENNTLSANNTFTACWMKVSGGECSPVIPLDLTNIEPKNSYSSQKDCETLTDKYNAGVDDIFTTFNQGTIIYSISLGLTLITALVVIAIKNKKRHATGTNTFKYDLTRFTKEVELT